MTRIKFKDKPTWHLTGTVVDGREVLASESPSSLLIRLKGTRQVLMLPWNTAYLRAATLAADALPHRTRRNVRRGVLSGA